MDNMASMKNNGSVAALQSGLVPAVPLGGQLGLSSPVDNMGTFRNMTNGFKTNMAFQSPGLSMVVSNSNQNLSSGYISTGMPQMNMSSPGIPNLHASGVSSALSQPSHTTRPTADMSAFDSLFGFQKPKVSINQMAQQKPNQWLNQYGVPYQASQDFSGSPLGTQATMMGQTSFNIQGNPFFSPQNFAQPAANTTNSSASKDLKDIFG